MWFGLNSVPQNRMPRPAGVEEVELFPTPQKFSKEGDWKVWLRLQHHGNLSTNRIVQYNNS